MYRRASGAVADLSKEAMQELERRYFTSHPDVEPRVYWRLRDDALNLTLRFLTHDRGSRNLKDRITRDILAEFRKAGIEISGPSMEITRLPPLLLQSGSLSERAIGRQPVPNL